MSKLCPVRLGDVIAVKHGFAFPGGDFTEEQSFPTLVTPGNFAIGGGFKPAKPKTFGGGFPEEYVLAAGDLIISMTDLSKEGATLGLPALVPDDGTYLHNQRVGLVQVLDPCKVDRYFLHYFLRTTGYRAHILGTATGSTVRHTSPTKICSFEAVLPDVVEQRAIAEVLGALDHKIAANTKLASTDESLAETMFRDLMSSAHGSASVGSILTLDYGKSLPANRRKDGPVAVYGSGGVVGTHDQALLAGPGVVVGRKGTAGAVHWAPGPFYPIDTTFYVVPSSADFPMIFCYFALRSLGLDEMNSDSAVPGLNRNEAHAAITRIPEVTAMSSFGSATTVLFQQRAQLQRECESLASMRDVLLPQLMSGRIRVRDVEQMVGDVV